MLYMQVIKNFVTSQALKWSEGEKQDPNSLAGFILNYIDSHNNLRDAQVEALKVYLWLKSIGNNYSGTDNMKIEKAEQFLSNAINTSGNNEKPVLAHSMRVAKYVSELGLEVDFVVSAVLHDVVEDSDTTVRDIHKGFGGKVAKYVDCLTIKKQLSTPSKQFNDSLARTISTSKQLLLIRGADILDNSYYYHLADTQLQPLLFEKIRLISEAIQEHCPNDKIQKDLERRIQELNINS